jgi:hypothetical protein
MTVSARRAPSSGVVQLSAPKVRSLAPLGVHMLERRRGFLEFVADRLGGRELPVEVQASYLRHIEDYLRFHNQSPQTERLSDLAAEQAIDAYVAWLERETPASEQSLLTARRAIELLYSDVFRIQINRS